MRPLLLIRFTLAVLAHGVLDFVAFRVRPECLLVTKLIKHVFQFHIVVAVPYELPEVKLRLVVQLLLAFVRKVGHNPVPVVAVLEYASDKLFRICLGPPFSCGSAGGSLRFG